VFTPPERNFHVAFVEFDEHGELWEPGQVGRAVKLIEGNQPVFLVTFIHGWKNNAACDNDNYDGFTNMLAGLAEQLKGPGKTRATVVGVYMGWRGDPMLCHDWLSLGARQLTFWSRKKAAERVAGTSATETIYSILQAANRNKESKVVLIGHSFGGLILEKAMSQAMVGSLFNGNGERERRAPADLVLMVNAAAPSIYARQFVTMLSRLPESEVGALSSEPGGQRPEGARTGGGETRAAHERPLIVSATSKGDWATRGVFPIGQWLGGLNKSFRRYDAEDKPAGKQGHFYRTTPGHNEELWTHKINRQTNAVPAEPPPTEPPRAYNQVEQKAMKQEAEKDALGEKDKKDPAVFEVGHRRFKIAPMKEDKRKNKTRYWVVRVPTKVIRSHGDIFNEGFSGLLGALIRMGEVDEPGPRR